MRSKSLSLAALLLVAAAASPSRAGEFGDAQKAFRAAFKPLKPPSAAALTKRIEDDLPQGIVTQAAPFDALIGKLLGPWAERLGLRETALNGLAGHPASKAGKLLQGAFKTVAEENAAIARQVTAVEATYAEVYNTGFLDGGESDKRTRKTAAVLIPFYRKLMLGNRWLTVVAGQVLDGLSGSEDLAWLAEQASKAKDTGFREAAAESLARIGGERARDAVAGLAREDDRPEVRVAALAALMRFPVKDGIETVLAALEDDTWQVRSLAVRICGAAKLSPATGALIERMSTERGRLVTDIDQALGAITGVRMQRDPALWRRWWEENREKVEEQSKRLFAEGAFDKPLGPVGTWEEPVAEAAKRSEKGGTASFYGIDIDSLRVVFVIDISRSMESPAGTVPAVTGERSNPYESPRGKSKLDVARWQLHRAVHELPDEAAFNIIVYSESYRVWQPDMVAAGKSVKKKAHQFVDGLRPNGTTNICDSLDRALEMAGLPPPPPGKKAGELAVDTIFLLSDGEPNRGRIADLDALLTDFIDRTTLTRIVVHTVGIGEAAGSSFLESLAERTGGRYVGFK